MNQHMQGQNVYGDQPTTASDDMRIGVTHHLQATFANEHDRTQNTVSKLAEQDSARRSPSQVNSQLNRDVLHNLN